MKGGDVVGCVVINIKWKEFEGREQLSDLPNCVCAAARSERQRLPMSFDTRYSTQGDTPLDAVDVWLLAKCADIQTLMAN